VVLEGKIHALSGAGPDRRNTPAHEGYDPATNSWTTLAPVLTPRDHLAAAVVGNHIYAIGGRVNGSYAENLAVNEAYDPATDSWHPRAAMPTVRSGIAAAVLNGKILVVGGEAPEGTFNEVEAYDPSTDSWTRYAPLPTARHGLGAVTTHGRVYVIAGGPKPGGSASALNEIFTLPASIGR
jgi:N-acetylneuraminic acid mutarotase